MSTLPKLTAEVDLAIVVRPECGCFFKWYFELEAEQVKANGSGWVDRDREYCAGSSQKHPGLEDQAYNLAFSKAEQIRAAVNASSKTRKD